MNTVSFINPRAQEAPAIPDPSLSSARLAADEITSAVLTVHDSTQMFVMRLNHSTLTCLEDVLRAWKNEQESEEQK